MHELIRASTQPKHLTNDPIVEKKHEMDSMMRSVHDNIGKFELGKLLNQKSFTTSPTSQVYEIRTLHSGKTFALKVIWRQFEALNYAPLTQKQHSYDKTLQGQPSSSQALPERKMHEKLKNRYIVQIMKGFDDPIHSYIVMEYCGGGNLAEWIQKEREGQSSSLQSVHRITIIKHWGQGIARALAYLHKNNIVHGDVRPDNILLTDDSDSTNIPHEIKVCDFSHSFQLNPHSFHSIVRPKCSCYCAPEILLACNEKIDTWSYGCLLYELVTGRPLFDFESFKEMSRFLTPTYLSTLKFEFEEYGDSLFGLAGLLKKLLCYEPEDRLTAEEILKHEFFVGRKKEIILETGKHVVFQQIPDKMVRNMRGEHRVTEKDKESNPKYTVRGKNTKESLSIPSVQTQENKPMNEITHRFPSKQIESRSKLNSLEAELPTHNHFIFKPTETDNFPNKYQFEHKHDRQYTEHIHNQPQKLTNTTECLSKPKDHSTNGETYLQFGRAKSKTLTHSSKENSQLLANKTTVIPVANCSNNNILITDRSETISKSINVPEKQYNLPIKEPHNLSPLNTIGLSIKPIIINHVYIQIDQDGLTVNDINQNDKPLELIHTDTNTQTTEPNLITYSKTTNLRDYDQNHTILSRESVYSSTQSRNPRILSTNQTPLLTVQPTKRIQISPNGHTICLSQHNHSKVYSLSTLPSKYHAKYLDCKRIVALVRNETPRCEYKNGWILMKIMFDGRVTVEINQEQSSLLDKEMAEEHEDKLLAEERANGKTLIYSFLPEQLKSPTPMVGVPVNVYARIRNIYTKLISME